jgi:hypothetical protein
MAVLSNSTIKIKSVLPIKRTISKISLPIKKAAGIKKRERENSTWKAYSSLRALHIPLVELRKALYVFTKK